MLSQSSPPWPAAARSEFEAIVQASHRADLDGIIVRIVSVSRKGSVIFSRYHPAIVDAIKAFPEPGRHYHPKAKAWALAPSYVPDLIEELDGFVKVELLEQPTAELFTGAHDQSLVSGMHAVLAGYAEPGSQERVALESAYTAYNSRQMVRTRRKRYAMSVARSSSSSAGCKCNGCTSLMSGLS
ncbi:MAG: hypothetical protein M3Y33_00500 [Actinomycetota bacterium]|nr:hypothetical protein [Actinomycetota bacterium]